MKQQHQQMMKVANVVTPMPASLQASIKSVKLPVDRMRGVAERRAEEDEE